MGGSGWLDSKQTCRLNQGIYVYARYKIARNSLVGNSGTRMITPAPFKTVPGIEAPDKVLHLNFAMEYTCNVRGGWNAPAVMTGRGGVP